MFLFQKFLELYVLALRSYVLELNLPSANPRTVLGLSLKPRMLWCSEVNGTSLQLEQHAQKSRIDNDCRVNLSRIGAYFRLVKPLIKC